MTDSNLPATKPASTDPASHRRIAATGSEALRYGDIGHRQSRLSGIVNAFLPNRAVSPTVMRGIILAEALLFLLVWLNSPFKVLPRPMEVLHALQRLWLHEGLGPDLITSYKLNLIALMWTVIISLVLCYLTVLPVFRPIVSAVSKGRFLSLFGFTFVLTLIVGGGAPLKTWLLVVSMTVFFVTSMAAVIVTIPKGDFDHARTLRMSEWRVVWEVVILGTADKAFEVLRQNAAIGWMMLTMVEGVVRSEGGIGTALINENKYFRLEGVFAIQLVILAVGLLQDYVIGALRRLCCPYADLTLERK
jgi:NitT/TauT family transport system permease protein